MRTQSAIDFDKWAELAKINPDAFEKLRSQYLTNVLNKIAEPRRHKFECLQWKIDQIRHTTKSPLSACIKISNLMWSSFDKLAEQYDHTESDCVLRAETPHKTATIMPFQTQL
jgi:hypothetical protein